MIKFAVKVGLATAAVYYVKEQGVWKNSNESIKTYEKLKETAKPYVQDLKAQLPVELPELPETERLSSLAKRSWNKGVMVTFKYISQFPNTVSNWTNKGIQKALENEDIKNFVNSFSSAKPVEQK
ncbi:MICOS complex subunit MIC13 homolog QIL1 isoform X2 [Anoplophora glabripennis]|uniref:MICOS complex subunit MIC13 homolog QIL1 isoform X2 n=1 Tax=Anoplophora glabripennis TaxID=217634 RepID=UPI0008748C6F|nr:MICOS complex subunit MIC13 homolog QIL1 isoform X2 [Anoplophora glabripennis]